MNQITAPYLIACFTLTLAVLNGLRPLATKVSLLDFPGGRKTHDSATPLVGGIGIFIGVLLISLALPSLLAEFAPLLLLSALVLFIGTVDDIKDLQPAVRMGGHSLVALSMAVVAENQIASFGNILYIGNIETSVLAIPITVFATIGVINAINMSDGVDGLSGGFMVIALGSVGVTALAGSNFGMASFISLLICSILAFLAMNFRRPWKRKALVYLGDAGSTMLGFILAWLLIEGSQGDERLFAPVYALWFIAIPLFDTVNLLFKRPLRGLSPFKPGTDHVHHALVSRGFSTGEIVFILLALSFLFAMAGMMGIYYEASEGFMFQLFISIFVVYLLTIDSLAARPKSPSIN